MSFQLRAGQILALLGRNGVGKTTLLRTCLGHTTLHSGEVSFDGASTTLWPIFRRARAGLGFVPQEREIFPSLTVLENLTVAARGSHWTLERVFDLFPNLARLRANMGNQLSGGEQQMLAVARVLMCDPRFLLLDEPLEGLAPVIVDALMEAFRRLQQEDQLGIILVEQHAQLALSFASDAMILDRGRTWGRALYSKAIPQSLPS
nr:ABC transporter ATP-binding protein [Bosea sp. AK1]